MLFPVWSVSQRCWVNHWTAWEIRVPSLTDYPRSSGQIWRYDMFFELNGLSVHGRAPSTLQPSEIPWTRCNGRTNIDCLSIHEDSAKSGEHGFSRRLRRTRVLGSETDQASAAMRIGHGVTVASLAQRWANR